MCMGYEWDIIMNHSYPISHQLPRWVCIVWTKMGFMVQASMLVRSANLRQGGDSSRLRMTVDYRFCAYGNRGATFVSRILEAFEFHHYKFVVSIHSLVI
jgi:hypothetical protein